MQILRTMASGDDMGTDPMDHVPDETPAPAQEVEEEAVEILSQSHKLFLVLLTLVIKLVDRSHGWKSELRSGRTSTLT